MTGQVEEWWRIEGKIELGKVELRVHWDWGCSLLWTEALDLITGAVCRALSSIQGKFLQMSMTTMKVHRQITQIIKSTASHGQKLRAFQSCVGYFTADAVNSCCAHLVSLQPPQYNICCVCGDLFSDRLPLSLTPTALQQCLEGLSELKRLQPWAPVAWISRPWAALWGFVILAS